LENFTEEIHEVPDRRPEGTKLRHSSTFVILPDNN